MLIFGFKIYMLSGKTKQSKIASNRGFIDIFRNVDGVF